MIAAPEQREAGHDLQRDVARLRVVEVKQRAGALHHLAGDEATRRQADLDAGLVHGPALRGRGIRRPRQVRRRRQAHGQVVVAPAIERPRNRDVDAQLRVHPSGLHVVGGRRARRQREVGREPARRVLGELAALHQANAEARAGLPVRDLRLATTDRPAVGPGERRVDELDLRALRRGDLDFDRGVLPHEEVPRGRHGDFRTRHVRRAYRTPEPRRTRSNRPPVPLGDPNGPPSTSCTRTVRPIALTIARQVRSWPSPRRIF